jgi:hypothetical protein
MVLPESLTVHSFWYSPDGGTTVLEASDEAGCEHVVMLVQHVSPEVTPHRDELPGRLYFDGELVPMRSDVETRVLALLRAAGTQSAGLLPDQDASDTRALLVSVIEFVESEEYLRFAERVEQAADTTRYTVWVVWEPATRDRVAVSLGRMLATAGKNACQLLDSAAPLAEAATALEVSELARRCSAHGLVLRVEPAFRWTIGLADPAERCT